MPRAINIDDLLEKKERNGNPDHHLSYKVQRLLSEWDKDQSKSDFFSDFVVIRLATILENAARVAIQRLVDHGAPFSTNGVKLLSKGSIKDAAGVLLAIHNEQISLGGLVAHSISTNRIDAIISALEEVVGDDFRIKFSSIRDRWRVEIEKKQDEPIINNLPETLSALDKLLKARHIIVHELPQKPAYQQADINPFLQNTYKFVFAIEWLITEMLYGKVPLTQTDMNIQSYEQAEVIRKDLGSMLEKIEQHMDDEESLAHFRKTQETWKTFVAMQAEQRAGRVGEHKNFPGSMAPLRCNSEYKARMAERLEDLRKRYDEDGRPIP